MKPKKRQKLCYNCEGEIDLDVIVCPYCAADLREEKPELQKVGPAVRPLQAQEMSSSLYPSGSIREQEEGVIPAKEPVPEESTRQMIGPIMLFAVGVQLLTLGLLLVICSDRGVVVLKWDARLWFLYLFASIPFLIFGYRSLSKTHF